MANVIILKEHWHCQGNILQKPVNGASYIVCSACKWNYTLNNGDVQAEFTEDVVETLAASSEKQLLI